MLGFKRFQTAAVTISGIELAAKIRRHQTKVGNLPGRPKTISWRNVNTRAELRTPVSITKTKAERWRVCWNVACLLEDVADAQCAIGIED